MSDDEQTDGVKELVNMLKAAVFSYKAPQTAFDSHSEVIMARMEPMHMMVVLRSMQAEAARARAALAKGEVHPDHKHFAQEYAAIRETYSRQMIVHLMNGLAEYQPEDADSSHSVSDRYLTELGLDVGPLPQDDPRPKPA